MAHPVFFSPGTTAAWGRMANQTSSPLGNSIGAYVLSVVNGTVHGQPPGQFGQYQAWYYAATGNPTYAAQAYALWYADVTKPMSQDRITDRVVEWWFVYDLIQPYLAANGLDATAQAALATIIAWLQDPAHGNLPNIRTHDADAADACFWAFALSDLAIGTTWLQGNYWDSTQLQAQPVGGLGYNPALGAYGTLRNILYTFVTSYARGGRWFYSSAYNLNIERYDLNGVQAVFTATQTEYFPEWRAFIPAMFAGHVFEFSGDFTQTDQWGDVENFRHAINAQRYADLMGVYEGMLQNDAVWGPIALGWWNEFQTLNFPGVTTPTSFFLWVFNPELTLPPGFAWRTALAAAWKSTLHDATLGPGRAVYQPDLLTPGLNAKSPTFFVSATWDKVTIQSDHYQFYKWIGDYRLFRKNELAVDHVISYGLAPEQHDATNGMLHSGLSAMANQQPQAVEVDQGGKQYCYFRAFHSGQYYGPKQPAPGTPPPGVVTEHTRSILYLPSADRTQDTIVIFDRVNSAPVSVGDYGKYTASSTVLDQQKLQTTGAAGNVAAAYLVQHHPSNPSVSPDGTTLSWSTAKNQSHVDMVQLLPSAGALTRQIFYMGDPSLQWFISCPQQNNLGACLNPNDWQWQSRTYYTVDTPWKPFLTVFNAYDPGQAASASLVQDGAGVVTGCLIQRGTANRAALVLFGAVVAQRLLSAGYTLNVTLSGPTDIYLMDLDRSKQWTLTIDGALPSPLVPTPAGIGLASWPCPGTWPLTLTAK